MSSALAGGRAVDGSRAVAGRFAIWMLCAVLLCAMLCSALCLTQCSVAFADDKGDPFEGAVSVGLADGRYAVGAEVSGGTGKAQVSSPATLQVQNGVASITLVWSSGFYDYMLVGGRKYLPLNLSGNSVFAIPVTSPDGKMTVVADTTRMSESHEVQYGLTIDLRSASPLSNGGAEAGGNSTASSGESASSDAAASGSAVPGDAAASGSVASSDVAASSDAAPSGDTSSADKGESSDLEKSSQATGENPALLLGIVGGLLVSSTVVFLVIGTRRNREEL